MLLSIQTHGDPATQTFGDYVHRCLDAALPERSTNPVSLVVVRLNEVRRRRLGRRGTAPQTRCIVEFRFERGSALVLREAGTDREEVIAKLAKRAKAALEELETWPLDRRRLEAPRLRRVS